MIVSLFKRVRLLISPHGATLSHVLWLPEGAGVVELAYSGTASMPFPASYFYTPSIALGLKYGVVAAEGEYNSLMRPNPVDVVYTVGLLLKSK